MTTKNEEFEEIIGLWKKLGVEKCVAEFSCGGDSMNDISFTLRNDNNEIIEGEGKDLLINYFDHNIYDEVDFYVNSDGHYMGESGVVEIHLEEDDEKSVFFYEKSSTAEWYESYSNNISVSVSEKVFRFILDKVSSLDGEKSSNFQINYKVDCIVTDEDELLVKELIDMVSEKGDEWEPETDGEYSDNSFNFELQDWNSLSEKEENTLYFNISKGFYEYRESDD